MLWGERGRLTMHRMITVPLLVTCVVCLAGCQRHIRYRHVKLITDRPWSVGEARSCSFDGQWNEMHCFPATPEALAAPKYNYLVDADFDKAVHFDAQQWAYDITCRLDSFGHATCRADERVGKESALLRPDASCSSASTMIDLCLPFSILGSTVSAMIRS